MLERLGMPSFSSKPLRRFYKSPAALLRGFCVLSAHFSGAFALDDNAGRILAPMPGFLGK
ncbi:hypothetical protein AT984_17005 [Paucibacter sp. KCTC 42545]|nr:hypothetical protein AT984_17005 [Paucibacter sp. KCTC 42545]